MISGRGKMKNRKEAEKKGLGVGYCFMKNAYTGSVDRLSVGLVV
jgi:hypothetical protein